MNDASEKEVVISLRDVGVHYRRRKGIFRKSEVLTGLSSVSIDIYRGETLGILGRNGAGKSTLLRVIAGILKPDQGVIENHGVTVSLLALQAGFDPELSGYDNAIISGMLMGFRRSEVMSRMGEIKSFSELDDFMGRPVKTYSTGMRSRLGFSVAMYLSPDVLLLDEVLSVGDKQFREKAEAEMKKKIHSQQTVVLVSHSESQINKLCDRVCYL
ncbi:ABC transporter ATP-binding protein [Microbulbifer elongatus]|uniref:ABC transporter ATP-binding protein n=1 Tax=Microbulbifer elongatus TaxID=86173 RepID=A0ABT1P3C8_9GAMM|nr:ABC transporter ATP-binding protein [Microbulbifer elongatus]MCQ3830622.1 ABC transporter ATP-binding protein [Microbulbifer elongatus]